MWARSHTSGLMIGLRHPLDVVVAERRDDGQRALARLGAGRGPGHPRASARVSRITRTVHASQSGRAPHLDHLADRRGAVGDARVQRADGQLEAAGLRCSSSVTRAWKRRPRLSTSTMSPAAMPFEVARRGGAAGLPRGRRSGGLATSRTLRAVRTEPRPPPHPRCSATLASRSVRTSTIVDRRGQRASSAASKPRRPRRARSRGRTAPRRRRSRSRAGWRRAR